MAIFLETERLILKSPNLWDYDNWCKLYAEQKNSNFSKETIWQWLNHHILEFQKLGFSMCSAFLKETGEFVGRAGLFYSNDVIDEKEILEVGYVIREKFWNLGFATELGSAILHWAFEHLMVEKIYAFTKVENTKSQHVLEKMGMSYLRKTQSEGEEFLLYGVDIQYYNDFIKKG